MGFVVSPLFWEGEPLVHTQDTLLTLTPWHFLDLLCSLASDLCFASWFLELLLETWRGHLRGSLRYIPGPSVLVGRVDS